MKERKERTNRDGLIEFFQRMPVRIKSIVDFRQAAIRLFPHVPDEALEGLYSAMSEGEVYAAAVPTTIKGAAVPIELENGILYPVEFAVKPVFYDREAQAYAAEQWGSELCEVKVTDLIKVYLQDPKTLAIEDCVYAVLSRIWGDIVLDESAPKSGLINDAIVYLTGDRAVFMELASLRKDLSNVPAFFQCSRCGGQIVAGGCIGCRQSFKYDPEVAEREWVRKNLGCALPEKIEVFIDRRHQEPFFVVSPVELRFKEKEAWYCKLRGSFKA